VNNHYIPQKYLKGFCTNGKLCVYVKDGTKPFYTNPRNVGSENKLYSDELEKYLQRNIEHPSDLVIQKIQERIPLSSEEKSKFVDYLVTLTIRNPTQKEEVIEFVKEKSDISINKIETNLQSINRSTPEEEYKYQGYLSSIERIKRNGINARDVWSHFIKQSPLLGMKQILVSLNWYFAFHPTKNVFITCDNPLYYNKILGLGNTGAEVFFPINNRIMLWMNWRVLKERYFEANNTFIIEANKRICLNAYKQLYFSHEEAWLNRLAN
jgi:hypothetical protein